MTAPGVLGHAYIEIRPRTEGFTRGVQAELGRSASAFGDAGKAGGQRFTSGFTGAANPGVFRSHIGVIATTIGAGMAAAGAAAVTMGVKTAASMEQAQVAFTTLLHSGKAAQSFLKDLSRFAAATPFTLPGLVDASRQLLGVGASAKSVIPTLTAWGDTAGALGLTQEQFSRTMIALTQAMANGKLQAGDLLQITQAGIPIWSVLARALGKPVAEVRKLSEGGKLLTADVLPKLEKQMEKDYGGAMAAQSRTLTGLWSTFTDTLSIGLATAVGPMVPALKTGLTGAINAVGAALRLIPAIGRLLGPVFRDIRLAGLAAAHGVVAGWRAVAPAVGTVVSRVRSAVLGVLDVARGRVSTHRLDVFGDTPGVLSALVRVGFGVRAAADWLRRLGPVLLSAGRAAGAVLVPALRDVGRWVVGTVVPALRSFGEGLLSVARTVGGWLGPSLRMLGQFLLASVAPAVRNVVVIAVTLGRALAGVAAAVLRVALPVLRVLALAVGVALLVAFRVLAFFLRDVVGPVLRGVTGFVKDHQGVVTAIAGAIGVLFIPALVRLGAAATVSAARQVAAWVASGAAATAAGVRYAAFSVFAIRYYVQVGAAAAASSVRQLAAWAVVGARAVAATAVTVAQLVVQGVRWLWLGRTAMVAALRVAAAWLVSMGPIAVVIASVAGLVFLIIKHWATIWRVTKQVWHAVAAFIAGIWDGIKSAFQSGVRFVVGVFLGLVSMIIGGAARAFGWVPGLGGKLREAAAKFNAFRDQVNATLGGVKSRTVNVTASLKTSSSLGGVSARAIADGAVLSSVRAFAGGGEDHTAHVAPAGTWRVFAEPETGGEAYIPLAPTKRPRSTRILADVAARFGYNLLPAAQGLIVSPQMTGLARFRASLDAYNKAVDRAAAALGRKALEAGGAFSANLAGVVRFAKSIAGTPYVWGGAQPSGSDCSGFVSMLVRVARGMSPAGRLFSTGSLPAGYFGTSGRVNQAFRVGWFTGNPGHVAATVNGIGMESRGGDGVVVNGLNGRSPGSTYNYFTRHAFLRMAQGGVLPGDPPFDLLSARGRYYQPNLRQLLQMVNAGRVGGYDVGAGRRWPTGTVGVNNSGEDEFVWRRSQLRTQPPSMVLNVNVDARGAADPAAVRAAVDAGGAALLNEVSRMLTAGVAA